jgi:cytoplasmic iron level regulating protein YaaA (DUF328/UPF0246 family)
MPDVLVLLPPSESKRPPAARGKPVDLATLSFPELTPTRIRVLDALTTASAAADALRRLDVGPSLAPEVERNMRLRTLPARPALEVYTGVLYDALGWPTLSASGRRRAASRLVVLSALWGALRASDRIPPYRLNMCGDVGLGVLNRLWRPALGRVMPEAARGLVVDCRSGDYAAAWPPSSEVATRTVAVRVVQEGRTASHAAKHTRGDVARHLLESGADPGRPQGLARVLGERWTVELVPPPRPGRPWTIDVLIPVPSSP